jgi:uroporphyrinogen III methyltransferase/synthase
VVHWGARPEQRVEVGTLANIAEKTRAAGLKNPSVVVVGEVVRLREKLRWYDLRPLFGKRLLVPRAAEQAERSARAIRARGAEPVLVPVIRILPPPDPAPLAAALGALSSYDWVLFTSENGVERTFAVLAEQGRDARAFGSAKVGVIGPRTADALARHGIRADLVAEEHVGEGLARDLLARGRPGKVLLSRARVARDELPRLLREAGGEVDVVPAYETQAVPGAELAARIREAAVEVVLLTSSSIVRSLVEALGSTAPEQLAALTVASIGPVTTKTAEELGVRVDVSAGVHTLDGLLDALEAYFRARALPAGGGE